MSIYTGNGDEGHTRRIDGERVSKTAPRLAAVGTVDEFNATLGMCVCQARSDGLDNLAEALLDIQNELFVIGSQLAAAGTPLFACVGEGIDEKCIKRMENQIDQAERITGQLESFIIPGGSELSARFHVARTVCRRAERTVIALVESGVEISHVLMKYFNRTSDLMFAFARLANHEKGFADVTWQKPDSQSEAV